ncbi:hypothetical protein AVEN_33615-1 [Araneus ventricosus]|uniref:Uncharacterized protein n=1 Tax=Araneus ventricosus TaxID=182803 RepID=A0A4Y2UZG8_ARAVE|nr:hypothetical protein AVEN_33610-1 [Araneus ventricosus]GBO17181.1 hypothetical protein AVEN_33615-1 [Araneus ventricosus]
MVFVGQGLPGALSPKFWYMMSPILLGIGRSKRLHFWKSLGSRTLFRVGVCPFFLGDKVEGQPNTGSFLLTLLFFTVSVGLTGYTGAWALYGSVRFPNQYSASGA